MIITLTQKEIENVDKDVCELIHALKQIGYKFSHEKIYKDLTAIALKNYMISTIEKSKFE